MKHRFLLALALAGVFALAACGSGGDDGPEVATANADIALDGTNGANVAGALAGNEFVFPDGVPEFGTTASTSFTVTNTATTPGFRIASGGNTATGTMDFGSCIFRVTDSSFGAGHQLAAGSTVTISSCRFQMQLRGSAADNTSREIIAVIIFNGRASVGRPIVVIITPNGVVIIAGRTIIIIIIGRLTGT